MRCSSCAKEFAASPADDDEPAVPPLEPQVDDSFVVVLDALDGSGDDPFTNTLGPRPGDANDSHAGVSESMRRQRRLRRAAAGAIPGDGAACGRCAAATAALLDDHAASAHARAALYVRSEREHALRDDAAEPARTRRRRRDGGAAALERRDALAEAVAAAKREARATRAARAALAAAAAALDAEEAAFFEAARAVDGELDGLRERAADLVGRANRRRDQDRTLDDLARSLDALDVDRAPFDRVDAYVRAACRRLEARSDEKKLVGTFVPDPA